MHLEVKVGREAAGVPGVAHEPDHLARADVRAVRGEGRERREVRVEELVALAVAEPEAVAGRVVPAHRVERAGRGRDERLAEPAEDVDPVLVGVALLGVPVAVARGRRAVDRVDVRGRRQRRLDLLRDADERPGGGRQEPWLRRRRTGPTSTMTGGAVSDEVSA